MLKVIHENDLGSNHIGGPFMGTSREQKLLLEAFINAQTMAGEGPMVYKEAKKVCNEIW
jgi:hypothetical protein